MVEKPKFEDAPSKQAIIGRYVLTPRVFELLEQTKPGAGGEIQLTDGIKALVLKERRSSATPSKASASTPATSWACCRRRWSLRSSAAI
jgi:UTP-glucose-1-phosphate uridylyltransferase